MTFCQAVIQRVILYTRLSRCDSLFADHGVRLTRSTEPITVTVILPALWQVCRSARAFALSSNKVAAVEVDTRPIL